MRRLLFVQLLLLCTLIAAGAPAWPQDAVAGPVIVFNGSPLGADIPVDTRQGELFLPLTQGVCYRLGATLDAYLEEDRIRAVVQWLGYQFEFTEEQAQMFVDGQSRSLPAAPYADEAGVLMVPAAEFFMAAQAQVTYDDAAMAMHVTRIVEAPDVVSQLPPELADPAADTQEQGMTQEQLEEFMGQDAGLIFTAENSFGVEVDSVSGDKTQSYLTPRQVVLDRFTLRMEGGITGGLNLTGFLRTAGSTDRDRKRGEIQKMNFLLEKPGLAVSLYDLLPKFSRYTLRNYRLQGVDVKHSQDGFSFHAVAGASPRKYKDSEYQRFAGAARAQWGAEAQHVALNVVAVRDTGTARRTEKLDNRVASVSARAVASGGWSLFGEMAGADTDFLLAGRDTSSTALQLQAKRKTRHSTLDLSYENTGSDFFSESANFTQGKHEWSALWNAKPHPRITLGLGHRNRLLRGNHTYIYPTLMSLAPWTSRSKFKVDLRRNYERTTGASHSLVDNRRVEVRDTLGSVSAQAALGRRKTKNNSGAVAFRTTYDYKAQFLVTPRVLCVAQYNKEKRQNSSTPLTRFYRTRFTVELGDWTDMSITVERYYNASRNSRAGAILGFRHLDINTDTEYLLDYTYMNYPAHNDHSLKMRYNIYR